MLLIAYFKLNQHVPSQLLSSHHGHRTPIAAYRYPAKLLKFAERLPLSTDTCSYHKEFTGRIEEGLAVSAVGGKVCVGVENQNKNALLTDLRQGNVDTQGHGVSPFLDASDMGGKLTAL